MPVSLFIIRKIPAFWVCYIAGLFIAEGLVILLHFALGKNMLVGDVFGAETATLITYHGYFIIAGVALFYWKVIEKKPLTAMGLSKETALILPKMEPLLFIFVCRPFALSGILCIYHFKSSISKLSVFKSQ